jgi:hypothetical protein
VHAADDPVALADVGRSAGLAAHRHLDRGFQVPLRDAPDRGGQRRREQRDLAPGRRLLENALDGIDEAHRQHLVGLVEHEETQAAQFQRAALDVIDHAPRRADDDVDAALQRVQLRLVALAAVDRQDVEARQVRGVALEGLRHLQREFARRHQHQHLRLTAAELDAGQRRQRERGRLAGAGLRLPEHVLAGQKHRDRRRLDRRWRFVADIGERAQHGVGQAEVAKGKRRRFRSQWGRSHGKPLKNERAV